MFNLFNREKIITLYAPLTGNAVELKEVKDTIFAEKIVGDGIAIEPTCGEMIAPCAGKVAKIFPTKHAILLETAHGFDVLIHIGIDTVELKGEGFNCKVDEGDLVKKGDILMEIDLEKIKALNKTVITPFVITTMDKVEINFTYTGEIVAGETAIMKIKVKKQES